LILSLRQGWGRCVERVVKLLLCEDMVVCVCVCVCACTCRGIYNTIRCTCDLLGREKCGQRVMHRRWSFYIGVYTLLQVDTWLLFWYQSLCKLSTKTLCLYYISVHNNNESSDEIEYFKWKIFRFHVSNENIIITIITFISCTYLLLI